MWETHVTEDLSNVKVRRGRERDIWKTRFELILDSWLENRLLMETYIIRTEKTLEHNKNQKQVPLTYIPREHIKSKLVYIIFQQNGKKKMREFYPSCKYTSLIRCSNTNSHQFNTSRIKSRFRLFQSISKFPTFIFKNRIQWFKRRSNVLQQSLI